MNGRGPLRFVVAEGEQPSLRTTPVGGVAAISGIAVCAAAVIALADDAVARAGASLVAIAAIVVSGLLRTASEVARRRSHVPALKRHQEHRVLEAPASVGLALQAASEELRRSGFRVERVEDAQAARVVLASRGGWAFSGSMLAHAGLALAIGSLVSGPLVSVRGPLAASVVVLAAGVALRLAFDPLVAWCAARAAEGGTALEIVVSGCVFPSRISRRADLLAEALERRLAGR
ncbi:MAG TPA: cytochrome c biogenesis protein ResB [Anaeromyxobacteraceae bacterium]|nr:cytochrome c biogenesis protein ResB [Anaeromyxobacteraceae bacterium]